MGKQMTLYEGQADINAWSAYELSLPNLSASHDVFKKNWTKGSIFKKKSTENYLFGGQVMLNEHCS